MAKMKWWGWGPEDQGFTDSDKPGFAPFVKEVLGIDVSRVNGPAPKFSEVKVPASVASAALLTELQAALGSAQHVSVDGHDRIVNARGKSIRDLIRQRRGDFPRIPDVIVWPADEEQVAAVVRIAIERDAVVIAFGGGSSISGSLEPSEWEARPLISLDLARLDRVLEIDRESGLARIQAGVLGPALESQLQAHGYTLGHFPDSFAHSSLGGWIATRSSGMQSDRYGDIADMTKGLRVITPAGALVVRAIPSTSNGPSLREMILGSEGRLGIITEATMQVRPIAQKRVVLGYLFPNFKAGLAAMHEIAQSEQTVTLARVADPAETRFSFSMRSKQTLLDKVQSAGMQIYLKKRLKWDTDQTCLSFIGFEGSERHVANQRYGVGQIVKRHGGLCIGEGAGVLYDQKKFDTPYIRDYLLDRGAAGDVSETAIAWSGLDQLYEAVMAATNEAFEQVSVHGYAMCHLSHSYLSGACLYFTFAFPTGPSGDLLADYDVVKAAVQQAFVDNGATLSHHHAVGTEHAPWMEQDVSPAGVAMLSGLFAGTDPGRNLNPGKIVDP